MLRPQALDQVADLLTPADFYRTAHSHIFQAMLDLRSRGEPVDLVTTTALLKERGRLEEVGGMVFLAQLSEHVGTAANAGFYARLVHEKALLRRYQALGLEIAKEAGKPETNIRDLQIFVESKLLDIGSRNGDSKGPHALSAKALESLEFPETNWIVPGILGTGYVILAGRPKLGKSWLALSLAVATATGGCALGKGDLRVTQGEVLFLGLEDGLRRLKSRLGKVMSGQAFPEGLLVAESWPRLDNGGLEALRKHLVEHPDCLLIVVDTLGKIRPPRSKNSDLYAYDVAIGGTLQGLAREFQVCILAVHHTRKSGAEDPLDEVSGSTGLTGSADGVMVLKRAKGKADGTLTVSGRDVGECELALRFHPEQGLWELMGTAADYAMSQERLEILRVLREHGPKTSKELAEILGKKAGSIKALMWKMSKSQEIKSIDHGKYICV